MGNFAYFLAIFFLVFGVMGAILLIGKMIMINHGVQ